MIRRPPRSTLSSSSAASDVYKRQTLGSTQALQLSSISGSRVKDVGLFKGWSAVGGGGKNATKTNAPTTTTSVPLTPEQQQVYLKRRLQEEAARNVSRAATTKNGGGINTSKTPTTTTAVSYTHLRAHETPEHLVCRLLLEKKKK
eukprot:TRINITY_DN21778_c0_g1_i1.p1 TRINITY_DN21778_c0_g1~~TRINITY_DN21778_c0_g1_i1.p1  ORF type:complete len:145 (+),score=49.63 TRINITY_DN21778_c0_g1_i1:133-567(+)